jgi:integrase
MRTRFRKPGNIPIAMRVTASVGQSLGQSNGREIAVATKTKLPTGIEERPSRDDKGLPSYRAWVWDRRTNTRVRKTFSGKGALTAAKAWRADATSALNKGTNVAPSKVTLKEVAEEWLAGAKSSPPTVLNRSGEPFKPSALRGYEADLNRYVLKELGTSRLSDIRRGEVQRLVDKWTGEGLSGSKVRNIVTSLKTILRWAIDREIVATNPTLNLRLPNGSKHRDRAASREEAAELLSALPVDIRPIYATAAYAGLRAGELRALRWADVNLEAHRINVHRSWDDREGEITPKSKAGTRTAPIPKVLRKLLAEHKLSQGLRTRDTDFVFASKNGGPFTPTNIRRRGLVAWEKVNKERAAKEQPLLDPIGLHELRHTAISLWFASGVRREVCEDWAGHSSGHVTDIYRHLRPEVFDAELALVDEYLAERVRLAVGS